MVGIAEQLPLEGPRWDVWPLHGKCDAVGGDEDEDDKIEPVWEVVQRLEYRSVPYHPLEVSSWQNIRVLQPGRQM